jgi:hypothetical protein
VSANIFIKESNTITKTEVNVIPANVIEALARCLLPTIRSYFESEDGQREFAEWENQQDTKGSSAPTAEKAELPLAN